MNDDLRQRIEAAVDEYNDKAYADARADFADRASTLLTIREDGTLEAEAIERLRMDAIGARYNLIRAAYNLRKLLKEKEEREHGNKTGSGRSE